MSKRPAIRFKGHTSDWTLRKLSTMCGTFEYGLNAAATEYDGRNKYIRITDIDDASREFSTANLSSPATCLEGMERYLLTNGDIVFARTGASTGKTYLYKERDGVVYFAGFLIRTKVNKENDPEFVFQNTLTPGYEKYIKITSQRSGQPGVNAQEYGNYELFAPLIEEQIQIGHSHKNLDELILWHQRKYDKLQTYKKAMLEKMFPKDGADVPEVRFAGFTDIWKRYKLSEILIQRIEHQTITSDAPLLAFSYAEGVINPEDKKTNKRDFIMTDKFSKIFSRTELNDIIYNPANVIHGAIHRNKLGTGVVSPIYKIFICNGVSAKYMGERLHTDKFIREISKYIEGTVVKLRTLSPEMFLEMVVEVPQSYTEQEKIGEFFEQLNVLIADQERKVSKLKDLKAALLNKMFI